MQMNFLFPTVVFFAAAALGQNIPQGPMQLPITTYEETTNAVRQAADTSEATNRAGAAKTSFLIEAGVQYADEGEYKEAEQAYLRALKDAPKNPDLRFRLGTLYIQMKQYGKAVDLLERLSKEFPDNPGIHNNLAWVYATGGEMKNGKLALRHAREAILAAPTQASMWNTLAEAYYVFGQYDKALSVSEYAIDLLKMQGADEKEISDFEGQRAKILRGKEAGKRLMGLDDEEE